MVCLPVQGSQDTPQRRSQSADDLLSDSASARHPRSSGRRFVTMCYIPNVNSRGGGGVAGGASPAHSSRTPVRTSTSSSSYYAAPSPFSPSPSSISSSSSPPGGEAGSRGAPPGQTRVSVVLLRGGEKDRDRDRDRDRAGRAAGGVGTPHTAAGRRGEEGSGRRLKNEMPLSEELALASSHSSSSPSSSSVSVSAAQRAAHASYFSYSSSSSLSTPHGYPQATTTPTSTSSSSVPKLALTRATMDAGSADVFGSRGPSGDELVEGEEAERDDDDRPLTYSSWSRELPPAAASFSRGARHHPHPHHHHHHHHRYHYGYGYGVDGEDGEGGSGASLEGSSVYSSCPSTSDSIASGSGSGGSSSELLDCHRLMKLINQPTVFKVSGVGLCVCGGEGMLWGCCRCCVCVCVCALWCV